MAGQLTIDQLKASSGVLATQNGMTGIAKAWVQFVPGATPTINGSFNVSSVTRVGTGVYTLNYTTSMPSIAYSLIGSGSSNASYSTVAFIPFSNLTTAVAPTVSASTFSVVNPSFGALDTNYVCASVFSA